MNVMGKAGGVLRQVLEDYSISQTKLANELGIGRSNVYHWVNAFPYLGSIDRRGLDLPVRNRLKDCENAFLRALVTLPLW